MKRTILLSAALGLLLMSPFPALRSADADEEQQLIHVLQSDGPPQDKDAACARLKRIGTVQSIPAIAALLSDKQLSHSARYALESMPYAEAGQALLDALEKTSGPTKSGIVLSLGIRHEKSAVPALAKLLAENSSTGAAAATALGQIGGPDALDALWAALDRARVGGGGVSAGVQQALVDAALRCANDSLASGDQAVALKAFEKIYKKSEAGSVRTAAFRGVLLASGNDRLKLMTKAIGGGDGPSQLAALQLVHETDVPGATKAFVGLLRKAAPPVQMALIGGLAQRGDPAAAAGIAQIAGSPDPQVRAAALTALGTLGDALMGTLLAEAAASSTGDERNAARESLALLNRGPVTEKLLEDLAAAKPPEQVELARALGRRGDTAAVPRLEEVARKGSESGAKAAFQALAVLAGEPDLRAMVQLVVDAKSDAARAEAVEAINAVCQRVQSTKGQVTVAPLVNGLAVESPDVPVALLPVFSGLTGPQVRSALRAAVSDSNPRIREAGFRALCDTVDPGLLPDVLKSAGEAPDENLRTLAIAACVRLATQDETAKLSNSEKLAVLSPLLAMPLRADQKRIVLSGVEQVPDARALALAEPLLNDAAVRAEAAQAVVRIAAALPVSDDRAAAMALTNVCSHGAEGATRRDAEAALQRIADRAEYITSWEAAGPYMQDGKECKALFDIAFAPETDDSADVKWRALAAGTDPKRPWLVDLLKAFGGEQRVAYARTWVHCDQQTPARMEVGSDDGVKVWLNKKLVLASNAVRGLQPGSDKAEVTLEPGWNSLMLKVTQYVRGWEFCVRLVKPDGSPLDSLQVDASRGKAE